MNKQFKILLVVICFSSLGMGCSTAPINGTLVSTEKNIWVNDPLNSGLIYCVANTDGVHADPVCYPARRGIPSERPPSTPSSYNSNSSSSTAPVPLPPVNTRGTY